MPLANRHRTYWRLNVLIVALLLVVWFIFSFGVAFFARQLDFRFFGWPFSFWVAAQGALIVFVLIIVVYAWVMNKLDDAIGAHPLPTSEAGEP